MDRRYTLLCLLIISLPSLLRADDNDGDTAEIRQGGFYVKFHKVGGKILVSKYKTSDTNNPDGGQETDDGDDGDDDEDGKDKNTTEVSSSKRVTGKEEEEKEKMQQAVEVDLKSMVETDDQGNAVIPNDTSKHTVDPQSFQSQNFTTKNATVCHAKIYCHSFEARFIKVPAKFLVNLYIAKQSSNASTEFEVDGTVHNITKNQMKMTFKITDWKFCNEPSCTKNGSGLYLSFAIKGSGKIKKLTSKSPDSEEYTMGKGQSIVLPTKSRVDGARKNMVSGYPKLTTDKSFTVQFDRFANEALYDPTITLDEIVDSGTTSSATREMFNLILQLVGLVAAMLVNKL